MRAKNKPNKHPSESWSPCQTEQERGGAIVREMTKDLMITLTKGQKKNTTWTTITGALHRSRLYD